VLLAALPLNRLLWLGLAVTVLALSCWRYRLQIQAAEFPQLRRARRNDTLSLTQAGITTSPVATNYGWRGQWSQLLHQTTLDTAYGQNPDRFTRRPCAPRLPEKAWINQPTTQAQTVSI